MMLAAGDKIIRAGGIGALEEDIIGGVDRDLKRLGGRDKVGVVLDKLKELKAESSTNAEFRTR